MPEYARLAISLADSLTVRGNPLRSSISLRSAFAILIKYSASDSWPAIATASVSSILAIFCVIFDPMKKPLLALLSEPRTTPSRVFMPTIVVILLLYTSAPGKLTSNARKWSQLAVRDAMVCRECSQLALQHLCYLLVDRV